MEQFLRKTVEHIFSNWTALKLAVEHSMGGPNSKQAAIESIDYMVNYLSNSHNLEAEDIEETLEDIMDQEFNTLCEDNSIKEIAQLLYRFLQLAKAGDTDRYEAEFNNLPIGNHWLLQSQAAKIQADLNQELDTSMSESEHESVQSPTDEAPPPSDSEWTHVKSRRKK